MEIHVRSLWFEGSVTNLPRPGEKFARQRLLFAQLLKAMIVNEAQPWAAAPQKLIRGLAFPAHNRHTIDLHMSTYTQKMCTCCCCCSCCVFWEDGLKR